MGRLNIPGRVSVIINVYNEEENITKCIEMLSKQTYSNIEIVVVNDGSTDNTKQVTIEALEKFTKLYNYTETNGPSLYSPMGIQYPMIVGIGISTGEYVIPLNCDDWWDPGFIKLMVGGIGNLLSALPATHLLDINNRLIPHSFPNYDFNRDMYLALVKGEG